MNNVNIYETILNHDNLLSYLQGSVRSNISTINHFVPNEQNNFTNNAIFYSSFYSEKINIDYEIDRVSEWYKTIDTIKFNIEEHSICSFIEIEKNLEKNFGYNTLKIFEEAVNIYLEEKKTNSFFQEISYKALKNFLYLIPTIEKYSPRLNIESDTGYINSTFNTKDYGILRALSTDKGEIHFSRVSEDIRIYKISGVFKTKDTRDLRNIEKILRML